MNKFKYLDKQLLPIYGFNGIDDYQTQISSKNITSNMIEEIILEMKNITKGYKLNIFNLLKNNDGLDDATCGLNFLKRILEESQVPYKITQIKNINYLCLNSPKLLLDYIEQKDINQQYYKNSYKNNYENIYEDNYENIYGNSYENSHKFFYIVGTSGNINRFTLNIYDDIYINNIEIIKKDEIILDKISITIYDCNVVEYYESFLNILNYLNGNIQNNKNIKIPFYQKLHIIPSKRNYIDIKLKEPCDYELCISYKNIGPHPQSFFIYDYCNYDSIEHEINSLDIIESGGIYPVHSYIIKTDHTIDKVKLYNNYIDSEDTHVINNIEKILDEYYLVNLDSINPFKEPKNIISKKFNKMCISWRETRVGLIEMCTIRVNYQYDDGHLKY